MARYKKHVWSAKKQRILEYDIEQGLTMQQIADKVGLKAASSIHEVMHSEEYQRRREEFKKDIIEASREVLKGHAVQAAQKVANLMRNGKPTDKIQLEAALHIINLTGVRPREIVETITHNYKPEEIDSALRVSKEIESISHRLSAKGSIFLLKKEPPITPAPSETIEATEKKDKTDGATEAPLDSTGSN
jgi:hypothetical protein